MLFISIKNWNEPCLPLLPSYVASLRLVLISVPMRLSFSSHLVFFSSFIFLKQLSDATVYKFHTHIDTVKCYDDKCVGI